MNLADNVQSDYANIIGFQKEGVPSWQSQHPERPPGSKIPAVFLYPKRNILHICTTIDDDGNACWNSEEMPINTWFKLNIRQQKLGKKYEFQILINDEIKHTKTNNQPMVFEGVNGVIANSYHPERNYPPPIGQYKDFRFILKGDDFVYFI